METGSVSLTLREMHVKTVMRYLSLSPTRMDPLRTTENSKCWQGCEGTRIPCAVGGKVTGGSPWEKSTQQTL